MRRRASTRPTGRTLAATPMRHSTAKSPSTPARSRRWSAGAPAPNTASPSTRSSRKARRARTNISGWRRASRSPAPRSTPRSSAAAPTAACPTCAAPPQLLQGKRIAPASARRWSSPAVRRSSARRRPKGWTRMFTAAGFEWRESGCSLCFYAGGEGFAPGSRMISSTNRNFEGRQGPGIRTHIASPETVAASALAGCIADPRKVRGTMTPFTTLTSIAAPLLRDNVDTDTIIPSREMRSTGRTGLADGLFAPWRYTRCRRATPDPRLRAQPARIRGRADRCWPGPISAADRAANMPSGRSPNGASLQSSREASRRSFAANCMRNGAAAGGAAARCGRGAGRAGR